jgi:hypothetical protein
MFLVVLEDERDVTSQQFPPMFVAFTAQQQNTLENGLIHLTV